MFPFLDFCEFYTHGESCYLKVPKLQDKVLIRVKMASLFPKQFQITILQAQTKVWPKTPMTRFMLFFSLSIAILWNL